MASDQEPTLLDTNFAELNAEFYDSSPWTYFEQRLAHLMLVASDHARYRAAFAEPLRLDGVELTVSHRDTGDVPTPEQSFTAIEAEVLLHHIAETLLRFVHGHADEEAPCPWLRMSALTSAAAFKTWVDRHVVQAADEDLAALCDRVFAVDPGRGDEVAALVRYLELFAGHILDADLYNAAKHGMALTGGAERREMTIADTAVFRRDGAAVRWLARWPWPATPDRPTRWTRRSRQFSPEAEIGLISIAINMMRSLWIRGRSRHLGEPWDQVLRLPAPDVLFEGLGVRHHVLTDWFEPLAYEGESRELIIQTRHLKSPNE